MKVSTLVGSVVAALVMGLGWDVETARRNVRVTTRLRFDGDTIVSVAEVLEADMCCEHHSYGEFRGAGETPEEALASLLDAVLVEVTLRDEDRRFGDLSPAWFEVEGRLSARHAQNARQPVGTVVKGDKLQRSRSARRASKDVLAYEVSTYSHLRSLGGAEDMS